MGNIKSNLQMLLNFRIFQAIDSYKHLALTLQNSLGNPLINERLILQDLNSQFYLNRSCSNTVNYFEKSI